LKYVADTQNTVIDAEGDLLVGDAADTVQRLAVGTTGQVLTVDTTIDGKIKWATPSSSTPAFVGCSVYKITTNQSIANDTDVIATFNAEEFDTDGYHDNSSNNSRITIPSGKGGKYLVVAGIAWAGNSSGLRNAELYKNGSLLVGNSQFAPSPAFSSRFTFSSIVSLSAADYIEIKVLQQSGGSLDLLAGAGTATRFGVVYLGA
jgi:hypothetical protein